ncbi:hypothetical protein LXL04_033502 [Taraxacum kok-saghyz]
MSVLFSHHRWLSISLSILRSSSWMPARGAYTPTSALPPFLCLSLLPEKDQPHTPVRLGGETADVYRWLAGNSSGNLDIMAQYWQGIAQVCINPLKTLLIAMSMLGFCSIQVCILITLTNLQSLLKEAECKELNLID